MKQKLLLTLFLVFAIAFSAIAQNKAVKGRVTSQIGEGVPGVSVFEKGTTNGTITDIDGNYEITVPTNAVLVFKAVGMKTTEQLVGAQSQMSISMDEDTTQLGEVIISGYSIQDKRSTTGSISTLKGEVIEFMPVQSFDKAIQGRIAGVNIASTSGQPGGGVNFQIRGVGSVGAGNEPLIIVDGIQLSNLNIGSQGSNNGSLGGVNPNDIASIEILKDAASAAIYGSQAANGVVLITTKKGKAGKPQITLNIQEGVTQPMNLYDVMNGSQFATIRREAYVNAGLSEATPIGLYGDPANPSAITDFDWVDLMFRNARLSTYDLSIAGGDEKTSFFLAGGFTTQKGQIIASDYKRANMRLNLTYKVSPKLSVGTDINLVKQFQNGSIENGNFVNGPFTATFVAQPSSRAVNPETGAFNPYPENGESHFFRYNIFQGVQQEVRQGSTISMLANIRATYQILPQLTFNTFFGIEHIDNEDRNNRPSSIPAFAAAGGSAFRRARRVTSFNNYQTLNYQQKFNDKHIVSGLLGLEFKSEQFENFTAQAQGFANPALRLLGQAATALPAGSFFNEFFRVGVFGQAKYEYDNRYFADFTLRTDGHSNFGSQSRWGTFYAGSVAWRVTSESFMQNLSFISDLKIRASYGVVGNSDIGPYRQVATFSSVAAAQYQGVSALRQAELGNDAITWEEERQISLGLDFALFKNRIYGSVDFWDYLTTGLLLNNQLPSDAGYVNPNTGTAVVIDNIGELSNKGIDIELGAAVLDIGGFKWNTAFNVSFVKNQWKDLPGVSDTLFVNAITPYIVGQPRNVFWGYEYAGVSPANGRALISDRNGNYSYTGVVADRKNLGTSVPTYFGGWTNTFSYKGLTFEIFFQYQGGNDVNVGDFYNLMQSGSSANNQLVSQLDRWQQPGDITNVPIPFQGQNVEGQQQQFNDANITRFISDGSYIRLKQLRLAYDLPTTWLSKIGLTRVNIYGQAINMATFTRFAGIDPEVVGANNQNSTSTFGTYPNGRQYTVGLTIGL
jgi:TonB-linked SusC/RagA family outer membrane protein